MITHDQVRALRAEARQAGDAVMVVACDVALGDVTVTEDNDDGEGYPDYSGGGHTVHELRQIRAILRGPADEAWALCAEAIASARAQED